MPRVPTVEANEDGWTDWIAPVMDGYRLVCCDCGLSHEMQFQACKVVKHNADGTWDADDLNIEEYRVFLRARRHERSTAQIRRHRHKKAS